MTKITRLHVDASTGTVTEIELTQEEIAQLEIDAAVQTAQQETEAEAKATAKAALLAQLGITEEQAKLLLS
jgi:hypothetical protein